jgi:hypothetical protein
VKAAVTAAACALVALAAGCGGDDDDESQQRPADLEADLVVVVRAEGPDGPAERRRIRCERLGAGSARCRGLAGLQPDQFEPVPRDVACTQIYGGPATASVRGELRGKTVDARFDRTDGCQIERWERNRVLLGD